MVDVPKFVASNARRGLDLLEFKGAGLRPKTVREARQMASGSVSADKVRRMAAWFARHTPDLSSPDAQAYASGRAERPTPGQVAWLLWGGGLGDDKLDAMRWAERTRDRLIEDGELSKASAGQIRVGSAVQYAVPKPPQPTEYATGIVSRVKRDGVLTVGGESREGSQRDPAVLLTVYARDENDRLFRTDREVVRLASELRVINDITDRIRKQVSQEVEAHLRDLVKEHNAKNPGEGKRVTFSMLEQVYRRGIGAYRSNPGSVRPTVASAEQWAYGRVNAFLQGVRSGRFPRTPFDRDLLPTGHPLSTRKNAGLSMRSDLVGSDDATMPQTEERDGASVSSRIEKATTKREDGEDFPSEAFAYVPDPEAPSTWKLRLWDSLDEKETPAQVGRAVAAFSSGGFRGNRVQIPSADLARVKSRVLRAWLKVHPEMDLEDAPSELADVRRSLPISYRPNTQASVPAFKPSCGTCEYACVETDEETGNAVLMCEKWDAPVQMSFYCDAWEICEEKAPGWLQNDEEEHSPEEGDSEENGDLEPYEMALEPDTLGEHLTILLSDTIAFYLQAHGAHWNVRGADFSQYHDLFGAIYEDVLEAIDPTAELIRKLGANAPSYISEISEISSLTEVPTTYTPQDLASALLVSNDEVLEHLRQVFTLANGLDEQGVANFVAERIDAHQKWSWQLRSSLSGSLPEEEKAPLVIMRSIQQEGSQFCVYSESGRSFGCYADQGQAEQRLAQIEAFSASLVGKSVQEIIETHDATHQMDIVDEVTKTIHDLLEDHLEVICGLAQPYQFSIEDKLGMIGKPNAGWISKSAEHRYTLGPAYVPNVEDAHGEWTDAETLQRAMWDWVRSEDRTIYLQHSEKPAGEMVEMLTWPFPIDAELTVPQQGVTKFTFPAETPFLGVIWEPWAWDLVKAGQLRGYSIGGKAQRVEADLPTL